MTNGAILCRGLLSMGPTRDDGDGGFAVAGDLTMEARKYTVRRMS